MGPRNDGTSYDERLLEPEAVNLEVIKVIWKEYV